MARSTWLLLSSLIDRHQRDHRATRYPGCIWLAILVGAGNRGHSQGSSTCRRTPGSELQWYMFGAAFMLAAAYTLKQNEHIRIDIVYGSFSRRVQHWIDLFGHIFFLMPLCSLMIYLFRALRSGCPSAPARFEPGRRTDPLAGQSHAARSASSCSACRASRRSSRRSRSCVATWTIQRPSFPRRAGRTRGQGARRRSSP